MWKAGAEKVKGGLADLSEVLENLATKDMLKMATMGKDSYGKEARHHAQGIEAQREVAHHRDRQAHRPG